MSLGWLFQIVALLFFLTVVAFFLGEYMARVFVGKRTLFSFVLLPAEYFIYRIFGIDPDEEMSWKAFTGNFLLWILIGIVFLFFLQLIQHLLPLNPEHLKSMNWDSALNSAISFVTGTDWQAYNAETSVSYFTAIVGFGTQNFVATATCMAVAVALINGLIRKADAGVGNFWVYLTRSVLYILLPLSVVLAAFLMFQGVPDNFDSYTRAKTLEGREQIIAQGPVASQMSVKLLSASGGDFFTANAAHPYENPTPFTDLIAILAFLVIAAAFPFMFGAMIKDRREGWMIFIAMSILFLLGLLFAIWSESSGSVIFDQLHISQGISMEGKEVRFGNVSSATFATAATATSCGAANSSFTSLMPLTGLVLMFNLSVGEAIFGGSGLGLVNMMFYVILAMFLIALMIGRSPEIYGKKLGSYEIIITSVALFTPGVLQLIFTAFAIIFDPNGANSGTHGLSEIFYTYSSTIKNNGSPFSSLKANTLFYNFTISIAMLAGYLITIIPALAIAGSMVIKNIVPKNIRFPTTNLLFMFILVGVVLIITCLSFLPIFMLGPLLEHLRALNGVIF